LGNKYINPKKMKITTKVFQFIICGTDTDVGKTLISSFFVRGLNCFYWKPIQSGIQGETDSEYVQRVSQISPKKILKEAYVFNEPVSPHWAAEIDNVKLIKSNLNLPNIEKNLLVETAGGLMVPLTRDFLQIDQIKIWNLPVILVCRSSLGTLNHTLLSIEALKKRKINILGLIINGKKHLDNPQTLKLFSGLPIIAEFPLIKNLSVNNLDFLWKDLNMEEKLAQILNK
tara:strand:+ start:762 stop:1448 length:687 start_codon:yes stop_codon:yes gene_type:complete